MAQRRQMSKRDIIKKKIKHFFIYLFVFLLIIGGAAAICCTVLFNAESITASGSNFYNEKQIIDAADVSAGDNIILMNRNEIKRKLLKRLPLLGDIKIKKILPSKVEISVNDAETDMAFICGDKYLYTSNYRAVKYTSDAPEKEILLVLNIGTPELGDKISISKDNVELIQSIISEFAEQQITDIDQIDISVSTDISVICENNFKVDLGAMEELEYKVKNVKSIINSVKEKYGADVRGRINVQNLSLDNSTSYFKIESVEKESIVQEINE